MKQSPRSAFRRYIDGLLLTWKWRIPLALIALGLIVYATGRGVAVTIVSAAVAAIALALVFLSDRRKVRRKDKGKQLWLAFLMTVGLWVVLRGVISFAEKSDDGGVPVEVAVDFEGNLQDIQGVSTIAILASMGFFGLVFSLTDNDQTMRRKRRMRTAS